MNTAEGNKAANVTLDVDQLEANGNRHDISIMSLQKNSQSKKLIGLSYFGCECNDSDDANIAQYFKVLLHIPILSKTKAYTISCLSTLSGSERVHI